MAIGFPVLSSSYSGSAFHSGAAPYRSAEPVTPVVLTPEQHAKTVTVECGGRAYTYDAAGNHIGTDVEVTAAPATATADMTASEILARSAAIADRQASARTEAEAKEWAALGAEYAKRGGDMAPMELMAARDRILAARAITHPVTGVLHDPVTLAPLSPAADATFEAWENLPVTDPRTIEEYAAEPTVAPQPIPARSSAWHRGLAKVRALVPR